MSLSYLSTQKNLFLKIAIGSYIGTGGDDQGFSQVTLSFDFTPKILIIGSNIFTYPENELCTNIFNTNLPSSMRDPTGNGKNNIAGGYIKIVWAEKSISWTTQYNMDWRPTGGSTVDNKIKLSTYSLNGEGITYNYICLGV